MIQFFLRCAFESQCTFENVDSIVVASQFEGEGCMMRLEDAQVVVQNGQLAAGIAQESASRKKKKEKFREKEQRQS